MINFSFIILVKRILKIATTTRTLFLTFILLNTAFNNLLIKQSDAKCVMKEACYNLRPLDSSQDPYEVKWLNCKYDQEPVSLDDKEAMNDFKKLCPTLFNGDDQMPLCCSKYQLEILKRDLGAAEAIVGSCASCYFNFRNVWCHMTCSPNQHEFLLPLEYKLVELRNFTKQWENYLKKQAENESDTNNNEDEEAEQDEHDEQEDNTNKHRFKRQVNNSTLNNNKKQTTKSTTNKISKISTSAKEKAKTSLKTTTLTTTTATTTTTEPEPEPEVDEHENNQDDEAQDNEIEEDNKKITDKNTNNVNKQIKTSNPPVYVNVITKLGYYLQEDYINRFIESCRDIKLYGNDALQSLCGVPSKSCTPYHFANYMGLIVPERPLDIYFTYALKEPQTVTVGQTYVNSSNFKINRIEREVLIRPIMPVFHRCNESFMYGDLDYGARCSCKACQASCEIYEEFLIAPKHQFKIGKVDGLSLIMSILFALFLAAFIKSLITFRPNKKKNKTTTTTNQTAESDQFRNRNQQNKKNKTFLSKLFKCCFWRKNKPNALSSLSHSDDNANLSPSPDLEKKNYPNRYKRMTDRIQKLNCLDKMLYFGEKLERFIEVRFTRMGKFCATYPTLVLVIGLSFCSLMCLGYFNFKVEKDPIKLWSADSSIARQNKKYFDENFNPFYRITQLIIEPKETVKPINYTDDKNVTHTITALQKSILNETFYLYQQINKIQAECVECEDETNRKEVSLNDICFQPLAPDNKNCSTQALFQYWQNDAEKFYESLNNNAQFDHLRDCMKNPFEMQCLSSFGGPIQPFMVIGSYGQNEEYLNAGSIVITFVINNYLNNKEETFKSMAWEAQVLNLLKNYTSDLINVYYTTERSIEDELERESKADIKIIGISYIMMFVYLTITLGKYSSLKPKVILLEMKIFLALAGVFLVLLSVVSSGGLFTYVGVPATLITLEVIPFLLLAVGVDNVYILVQTYQNDERLPNETIEDQISRIVGRVGPSMLLTGTTQSAAFVISALTPMPGVRAFSLYASLAIIINFFMQITCFVVLLTLDAKRELAKRVDLLCCIKLNVRDSDAANNGRKSFLHKFFKNIYTPLLMNNGVRAFIIIVFMGFFFACVAMCDKIKVGLDQKLTMPSDSYQIKYFEALQKHLAVGPPVYFVLKDGYNYTDLDSLRKLCGGSTCETSSLQSLISSASFFPNETFIAQSSVNWIDDYFEWLAANPNVMSCCYIFKNTSKFCDYKKLSDESSHLIHDCESCPVDRVKYNFPSNHSFLKYVKHFLKQNPSRDCIKAGHAMYDNAVKLITDKHDHVTRIGPSHFMAYHKVLSTSDDFVNAMISANQISQSITKMLNENSTSNTKYEVFPYSIFYVFYEQYLKIWQDATMQLILTLVAIFICTFILLSFDLFTSLIVTGLIAIIIIDMVGIMFLWNIELNAISLVNLVIAIGISVEFCSHIARAFATSNAKTRKERASEALYKMGPPVFSGVLQSIVGISVLAFAHSQLFQVFYFRMYFSILMLGLTHGLIFLPVLLSYIGRSTNHLAYYKVNQGVNLMELGSFNNKDPNNNDNSNENTPISVNENNSQDHVLSSADTSKTSPMHQVPISLEEEDEDEEELKNDFVRLPTSSDSTHRRTNNNDRLTKYYYNSPKINHNNHDRDSPISKKSIDFLLNDQNSTNENDSVNSSTPSDQNVQQINETNLDDNNNTNNNSINTNKIKSSKDDQLVVKTSNNFSSKLNNIFKFNKNNNKAINHNHENGYQSGENQNGGDILSNSLNYKIKLNENLIFNNKTKAKSTSESANLNSNSITYKVK